VAELKTVEVRVKPRIDAVVVRPGDTLVVRVAPDMTPEQAAELKANLLDRLPGIDAVIVGSDQMLVYRPDGAGEDG
jgi:ABC-type sugar transport system substrate-binding protein